MNRSTQIARIARVAMWIMIGVLLLSFFIKGKWITVTWGVAAAVFLMCTLLVAFNKNR